MLVARVRAAVDGDEEFDRDEDHDVAYTTSTVI